MFLPRSVCGFQTGTGYEDVETWRTVWISVTLHSSILQCITEKMWKLKYIYAGWYEQIPLKRSVWWNLYIDFLPGAVQQ